MFTQSGQQSGSFIYRLWGSVIFLFAISVRFSEDFDFLLTLSNTRQNIFLAKLGTAFASSTLFSGLILLERILVDGLNKSLGYMNINDPLHLFSPYASGNLWLQFLYFFMLCFCCSLAGIMLGALFYRFGKTFTLIIWLALSALSLLATPAFLWFLHQRGELTAAMAALGEHLRSFDISTASLLLLLFSLVFATATYLIIRKLPQRTIV